MSIRNRRICTRGREIAAGRRADELDAQVGGSVSGFVAHAKGAHFTDVDGREYVDLCLGIPAQ